MKYLFLIIIAFVFACADCQDGGQEIENLIAEEITFGSSVMVYYDKGHVDLEVDDGGQTVAYSFDVESLPRIDGIAVGTSRRGITTGCFSIPTCIRMDELKKGTIKKSVDDFSVYHEIDNTGVLYFLTDFYSPYWHSNGNYHAFRNQVDNHGGKKYKNKRKGCCLNNPEKCHCEPEEE